MRKSDKEKAPIRKVIGHQVLAEVPNPASGVEDTHSSVTQDDLNTAGVPSEVQEIRITDLGKDLMSYDFPDGRFLFFDLEEKVVVVIGIVVCQGKLLHVGPFRHLSRLLPTAMTPALFRLQFLRGVLGVMNEEVSAMGEVD